MTLQPKKATTYGLVLSGGGTRGMAHIGAIKAMEEYGIRPMIASAAVPGVLSPVEIDGILYSDGGILNNFPIEPLQVHCDKIIGIYLSPVKQIEAKDLKYSYNVMDRAYHIATAKDSIQKFPLFDLVICPEELYPYGNFNMYSLDTIFEIGYQTAKRAIAELVS